MKLPITFRFEYKFDDEITIYYASVVGDEVLIDWDMNKGKPRKWRKIDVEELIEEGTWIIVDEENKQHKYELIGLEIGQLVDKKNIQYGDSFNKSGQILEILYPNGVQPTSYRELLAVTRVIDKLMRIANGNQGEENAWNDIGGYSILMSGNKNGES